MSTRPTLVNLPPAIHGARDYQELARLGLNPDDIIDFSANSNPYGPHPAVLQAVRQAATGPTLARYPDRDCLALREVIAVTEGVSPDQILPTNGASELIQLIALAFATSGSRHLILAPTFGEYNRAIYLVGGTIQEHRPANSSNLRFNVDAAIVAIHQHQPDTIWLCNPNNPTGQHWAEAELAQLGTAAPEALWIIDESYRYFSKQMPVISGHKLALPPENVIIIRSLTKEHGLAGLRLGYAIAAPGVIETLRAVQPPWSVNSLAQVAGVAALQPDVLIWRDETLAQLHRHAAELWQSLSKLGLRVLPTETTYTLTEVGHGVDFRAKLLKCGLLVRDCASFGLPEYVRIAAQLPEENEKLVRGVKSILANNR